MAEVQAHRKIVKSPPELWAELSDPECLARHLGEFGEIRITRTDPETAVAWEGEDISGTVSLAPSGWGTEVSVHARVAVPAPEPLPAPAPESVEHVLRVVDEKVVRIELPAPPPPPAVEPEPEARAQAPDERRGFLARLFGRAPDPEPVRPPEPDPEPEPLPAPEPCELRVMHTVAACMVPARPAPPPPEPAIDPDRVADVLAYVLEHLGSAHHRPFSRA